MYFCIETLHRIPQTTIISKFPKKWVSCKQNCDGVSFKYAITTPPITYQKMSYCSNRKSRKETGTHEKP